VGVTSGVPPSSAAVVEVGTSTVGDGWMTVIPDGVGR
jgi:hypothetical protein